MLEFRSGGRRVSQSEFLENIKNEAIEAGLKQLEQQVHAAAASISTRRPGNTPRFLSAAAAQTELTLRTRGSPAFVRELETRLDVEAGSIETMSPQATTDVPRVYLAHASEDHDTLAKPLAESLMAKGIEVWFERRSRSCIGTLMRGNGGF